MMNIVTLSINRSMLIVSMFLAILLFNSSCSSGKDTNPREIINLKQLMLAEYTLDGMFLVDSTKYERFKPGQRILVYSTRITARAGIDMREFNWDTDYKEDSTQKTVTLTLPQPEIFDFSMGDDEIKMVYYHVDRGRWQFTYKEKEQAKESAQFEFEKRIKTTDILDRAKDNARVFYKTQYGAIGYECNVNFKPEIK